LAEATTNLQDYLDNLKANARDTASGGGYNSYVGIAKAGWDSNYKTNVEEKREDLYTELKTQVGFDNFTDTQKALFEEELLAWEKEYFTTCNGSAESIECREAFAIKKDAEKARSETTYYTGMTASERAAFETGRASDVAALEASLAVAWLADNQPTGTAEGTSCETTVCEGANQCCGTSTPRSGAYVTPALENICVDQTTLVIS